MLLRRPKRELVGTYFAEQSSSTSYDLVAVASDKRQLQQVLKEKEDAQAEKENKFKVSSLPGSASGLRKKMKLGQEGSRCTVLPALRSMDLLLAASNARDPDAEFESSEIYSLEAQLNNLEKLRCEPVAAAAPGTPGRPNLLASIAEPPSEKEVQKAIREQQLSRSAARLSRGDPAPTRRRKIPPRATLTDEDYVKSMTESPSNFPKLSPSSASSSTTRLFSSSSSSRRSPSKKKSYHEVVQSGLHGTELQEPNVGVVRKQIPQLFKGKQPLQKLDVDHLLSAFEADMLPPSSVQLFLDKEAKPSTAPTAPKALPQVVKVTEQQKQKSVMKQKTFARGLNRFADRRGSAAQPGPVAALFPNGGEGAGNGDSILVSEEPHSPEEGFARNIVEAVSLSAKLGQFRTEVSKMLRLFVAEAVVWGRSDPKSLERALRERSGTRAQIECLYNFWVALDDDGSGRVDMDEFRTFVERILKEGQEKSEKGGTSTSVQFQLIDTGSPEENHKLGMDLCEKLGQALMGKKPFFIIEDLMRIIWPYSTLADLKQMKGICRELALTNWRLPPPKTLPKDELEALSAVFRHFDNDGSGSVTADELIDSGIMDKEQARKLVNEADDDGSGELSLIEFCELFCPTGYRAHSRAQIGTDETGRVLVFDAVLDGWRFEDVDVTALSQAWS